MLHVDNANAMDVVTPAGIQFTKILVEYGTAGNVAPMGIESFDEKVRRLNTVRGSVDDIMRAIEIVSSHGKERGTNGLPKLLPGINLIHGLPGADSASHAENLRCLRLILDQGFMTFRTFYRDLAPPTGVSLNRLSFVTKPKYEHYRRDIVEQFVIPMQEKVYPAGITLRGDWEIVQKGGEMHGRLFGSTPIRIALEGQVSPGCGIPLSVNVTGNRDYRLLTGKVVSEMNLEAL
jgi:radical SAM domain protein